jgi:DNA repair exonuclease SbcCD ATPase subunit
MKTAHPSVRIGLFGSLMMLAACASAAVEVPPETAQDLGSLKSSLVSGRAQIKRTTNAARDLTKASSAQLETHIAHLLNEVDVLEKTALKTRALHEAQATEAKAYFAEWDSELKTMTESVREAGQERREETIESFEVLKSKLDDLKGTFRPYMGALNEAARYLKSDKTAAGVKAILPRIEEALDAEGELLDQIESATAQIDKMLGK